jgi:1-acyl-sn-glycerol-3-phosphate acyltransferase
MLYRFARFILRLYFLIFYRVKIIGHENIPEKGQLLLYANHPSAWDMILIACFMKRKVHYMAKIELFKNPILGFLLRKIGAFPVNRGKGDVGSIKTVFRLLKEGRIVGVFPEGTRSKKRNPKLIKSGAAMLALHSKAPVLPVGVEWNSKLFSTLKVVFGKPFVISQKKEHITREELKEISVKIMDKIYSLIEQK